MILGIGMDVVEIDRFQRALERHGDRFRSRLFTNRERGYCESNVNSVPYFSVRFAAKEAFAKALGKGIAEGIRWTDVEILRAENGKPSIQLHGKAEELFRMNGGKHVWLSMTHSHNIAAATVVLEG